MPKASKASASESQKLDGYEGHYEELGGYTVAFETYTADADIAPLYQGLPEDRCQCPHFGYVIKGKVTFKFADREETYETGDAYYAPAGHTPVLYSGTEIVEFSPTEDLGKTMEVVMRNVAAMQGATA